jgi:hypothetical protein
MDAHVPQLITCEASTPPTQTVKIAIIGQDANGQESGGSGTESSARSVGLTEHGGSQHSTSTGVAEAKLTDEEALAAIQALDVSDDADFEEYLATLCPGVPPARVARGIHDFSGEVELEDFLARVARDIRNYSDGEFSAFLGIGQAEDCGSPEVTLATPAHEELEVTAADEFIDFVAMHECLGADGATSPMDQEGGELDGLLSFLLKGVASGAGGAGGAGDRPTITAPDVSKKTAPETMHVAKGDGSPAIPMGSPPKRSKRFRHPASGMSIVKGKLCETTSVCGAQGWDNTHYTSTHAAMLQSTSPRVIPPSGITS